jgi:hypothetical protein
MAVKTLQEITTAMNTLLGDAPTDEGLALLEDITDTMNANDNENWRQKYEDNDAQWRKRYKERFMNPPENPEDDPNKEGTKVSRSYDDLFKVKEK